MAASAATGASRDDVGQEIDVNCTKGQTYDTDTLRFTGWTAGDGSSTEGYSAWAYFDADGLYRGADEFGIEPEFEARAIKINGVSTAVPAGAVAYKYADPTEGARWVYDESDADDIASEDRSLLVRVSDVE